MMIAHHLKSERESRLFKIPFSFFSSQRYNEVRSEPLHPCDEDDECHLHDRVAPRDGHLAQGDKVSPWADKVCSRQLGPYLTNNNYHYFECISCKSKTSLLNNTVLSNSNTKLREFVVLMYQFCDNHKT